MVVFENPAEREGIIREAKAGQVILINYGMLGSLAEALKSRRWSSMVLDEAQQIKNAGTQRAKLLFQLDGDFRLALSGTPSRTIWGSCGASSPLLTRGCSAALASSSVALERRSRIPSTWRCCGR